MLVGPLWEAGAQMESVVHWESYGVVGGKEAEEGGTGLLAGGRSDPREERDREEPGWGGRGTGSVEALRKFQPGQGLQACVLFRLVLARNGEPEFHHLLCQGLGCLAGVGHTPRARLPEAVGS